MDVKETIITSDAERMALFMQDIAELAVKYGVDKMTNSSPDTVAFNVGKFICEYIAGLKKTPSDTGK